MSNERARMETAQLVAEHYGSVYGYAFRLSGSAPEAEDLAQQTFLTAHQKLDQLRGDETARAWLFAILRNCFLKGRQRWQPAPAVDVQLNLESIPSEPPGEAEIDRERLQEAIGELPEAFRVVLVMYYFEDLAYREIAEKLDLPIGTVMSRLARAKAHLRSRLFEPAAAKAENDRPE